MYTLFIDTHYIKLIMAIYKDGKVIAKSELESNIHSTNTVNMLNNLLNSFNLNVNDLNEVIVINGPGSFTGVRIGIVIAKMLGFTLNIPIKAITYLEAISLNYNEEVTIGLKEKNGVFLGTFDLNKNLKGEYKYLKNTELDSSLNIIYDTELDLTKIYNYMKTKKSINPHLLKPLYIKKIEVEKWLEKQQFLTYQELMN